MLSTALAHAMAASGIERRELGRGGRDMTRLTVALEQGNAAELRRFFEESKGWSEWMACA